MPDHPIAVGRQRRLTRLDLGSHRASLMAILPELDALVAAATHLPLKPSVIDRVLRRHPKARGELFSRSELIAGIRELSAAAQLGADVETLVAAVRMRPVRTQSGVTPVTVLTKPFPCPGTCVFCPNDVRMPKSYLAREPGCQRALQNGFDPYLQTYNRVMAFAALGHSVSKVEIIILGGTWSFYPEPYQLWFIKRCFDALNDVGKAVDHQSDVAQAEASQSWQTSAASSETSYNQRVMRELVDRHGASGIDAAEHATWHELQAAQRENESSRCRNVGLAVETRPDRLDQEEALRLRRLGCTKVQIGYQSLSDSVLAQNRRGHDVAATRLAMKQLRAVGFKIHAHWMPNLLGSTPDDDVHDFQRMFSDADFRPDELKIYPCSLVESADLMQFYAAGQWRPYTRAELLHVLSAALLATPRYCRLSRVIRDISSEDIVAGNRLSNFRELAERALLDAGTGSQDIRRREIKHGAFSREQLTLRVTAYATAIGQEQFLELTTAEDSLVAFLRLSLPAEPVAIAEIAHSAMIRELHVYGAALCLGTRAVARPQHQGLGKWLLQEAKLRAGRAGFRDLAVISAIGTRPYYRKQGFSDGGLYQHMPC